MKEIRDIAHAYEEAQKQGLRAALATVVSIKGSSYRRPGARMLITEDGKLTGAISGGCLDGHVQRKALLVITQNKPTLVTYDSLGEDETGGARLGCNGIIRIFIEPVIAGDPYHPVHLLNQVINQRQKAVLATIFSAANSPVPAATSLLYHENGCIAGNMPDALIGNALVKDCENVFTSKAPAIISYTFNENASVKAYIDYIAPPVSIVIVGAGNDAIPLAIMSSALGWEATIVDGRANYATRDRFPGAQKVICIKPGKIRSAIQIDGQTVFVLMTHSYDYDLAVLEQILFQNIPYIGILGPKKKEQKLFRDLGEKGIVLTPQEKSRIFGPAGLDIGAETPEEIALSITAEIKKVLASGNGMSLREKKRSIHMAEEVNAGLFNRAIV